MRRLTSAVLGTLLAGVLATLITATPATSRAASEEKEPLRLNPVRATTETPVFWTGIDEQHVIEYRDRDDIDEVSESSEIDSETTWRAEVHRVDEIRWRVVLHDWSHTADDETDTSLRGATLTLRGDGVWERERGSPKPSRSAALWIGDSFIPLLQAQLGQSWIAALEPGRPVRAGETWQPDPAPLLAHLVLADGQGRGRATGEIEVTLEGRDPFATVETAILQATAAYSTKTRRQRDGKRTLDADQVFRWTLDGSFPCGAAIGPAEGRIEMTGRYRGALPGRSRGIDMNYLLERRIRRKLAFSIESLEAGLAGWRAESTERAAWAENDWEGTLRRATDSRKPVLLAFTAMGDMDCAALDGAMSESAAIQRELARFERTRIWVRDPNDREGAGKRRERMRAAFDTGDAPLHVILGTDGRERARFADLETEDLTGAYLRFLHSVH